jgi:hypothetical protein
VKVFECRAFPAGHKHKFEAIRASRMDAGHAHFDKLLDPK